VNEIRENGPHLPLSTAVVVTSQHQSVLRFLRRRGATPQDALDIAQDTYVRFLRYEGVTGIESPAAMLFRIAGNVAADHGRAAALRGKTRSFDAHDAEIASEHPSAEREVAAEQVLTAVRSAIAGLSPRCRTVFLLSRLDGLTYLEIAARCGISVKMVEKHVSHALRACVERSVGLAHDLPFSARRNAACSRRNDDRAYESGSPQFRGSEEVLSESVSAVRIRRQDGG
jgi:RNA polymerase sigma factor (sigma-70 family)